MTSQTGHDGTKDVEIRVPLKCLSCFWRTVEMPLINWEISFVLTWSENYFVVVSTAANQVSIFAITVTKLVQLKITQNYFSS